MQPSGQTYDIEELGASDLRRLAISIHLDAIAAEIARVSTLSSSDPERMERLYELSHKQKTLLDAQRPPVQA
jgi:hypothetical protein